MNEVFELIHHVLFSVGYFIYTSSFKLGSKKPANGMDKNKFTSAKSILIQYKNESKY